MLSALVRAIENLVMRSLSLNVNSASASDSLECSSDVLPA